MLQENPGFIVNNITGEEVTVRVKSLYYDISDFKTLVPGIYKNKRRGDLKLDSKFYSRIDRNVIKDYPLSIRDYRAGRPIKWNVDALSTIFPNLTQLEANQTQEDRVKLHVRALAQSFGAIGVLVPMMMQF